MLGENLGISSFWEKKKIFKWDHILPSTKRNLSCYFVEFTDICFQSDKSNVRKQIYVYKF